MLTVSSDLGLRTASEENASLAADVNKFKVRVKNMEKKMDEK